MIYPVHPVTLPTNLANQPNGKLDPTLLYPVTGGGQLEAYTCWYYTILTQECAKANLVLTYTGTYRTYAQQVALWYQRMTTQPVSNNSRIWNGVVWYLRPGMASCAVPGTSNHGTGIAIDIAENGFGTHAQPITQHGLVVVAYINAAHNLGFSWEGDPHSRLFEPWHIRHYRPS